MPKKDGNSFWLVGGGILISMHSFFFWLPSISSDYFSKIWHSGALEMTLIFVTFYEFLQAYLHHLSKDYIMISAI